jgi:hypothetical protein
MDSPSPLLRLFFKGRECRLTYRLLSNMARYRRNGSLPSRAEGPSQSGHEAVAGSMSQKSRMRQNASVSATTASYTGCAALGTDLERVDFIVRPLGQDECRRP